MKRRLCLGLLITLFFVIETRVWAGPIAKELYYTKKTSLSYPKTYVFRFSFWDAESEGTQVWSEEKPVRITSNTIKTYLGDTIKFETVPVDFSQQYWVRVERKKKDGSFIAIGPRDRLTAVPYALWGGNGQTGGGGLGLYDGGGLFLGHLISISDSVYTVLNLSIPAVLKIVIEQPPRFEPYTIRMHYVQENCEGLSYTVPGQVGLYGFGSFGINALYVPQFSPTTYFILDTTLPVLAGDQIRSRQDGAGGCESASYPSSFAAVPLKQVDVPLMSQQLQNPLVVGPIQ